MKSLAKWVWYGDFGYDLVNSWMHARREFTLGAVPRKAEVNVTADARYRLYVNGKHVNRGPARGYQESQPFDTVDLAPFLTRGRNTIAAIVHNYGIGTFQYVHRGYAGFWLDGNVGKVDVSTGGQWRVRPAPGYLRDTTRLSLQLGFQEFFDLRKDDDSWMLSGYDDSKWIVANCRETGSMPWHSMEERGIPLLRESVALPHSVVSGASGKCARDWLDATDIVALSLSERKRWRATPVPLRGVSPCPRGDLICPWSVLEIPATGRHRYAAFCLDFGEEVVGSLRLEVDNATGDEIIDTMACEQLVGGAPAFMSPATGCRVAMGNRLFLRKKANEHEQFEPWGFRYLVVIARNVTKPLRMRLRLHATGYPLDVRAEFRSSNETLNRIYEICVRTQERCMLDAYMDCPWREQAQWWGDARVQAANTFYLSADARMLARGVRQIAGQEVPNGLTYGHAPTIAHNCILPDFTLVWLMTHWDYYWQTGDLSLFREMAARVRRALGYFEGQVAECGLLPTDPRYWLFLDWAPLHRDGYSTLYNLMYLIALQLTGELFRLCRMDADRRACARRARKLESAIVSCLLDRRRGVLIDGLDSKGKPVRQVSAHTAALAILSGILPGQHEQFTRKMILPIVGQLSPEDPFTPSPFFMYYIFEALKRMGRDESVIECIERWWGWMLEQGFSTACEMWKIEPGFVSLCHAWSAHPVVHLSNIMLGVRQAKPNWRAVTFSPVVTHADHVEGKIATPHGIIHAGWEKTVQGTRTWLELPRGIKRAGAR